MIHTIRFKLPDEQPELDLAMKAGRMASLIDEWTEYLRNKVKYEELSETELKIYTEIRTAWHNFRAACDA